MEMITITFLAIIAYYFIKNAKNLAEYAKKELSNRNGNIGYLNHGESNFGEYSNSLYSKGYLMTKREALFFRKLSEYIQNKDYIICPKVRLEDIIGVRNTGQFRPWIVSSKLDRSHIDFVLIGKTDLKTKFAIELDDTTHDTIKGNKHDSIKDEAFSKINIPLIRFREANITAEELYRNGIA